MYANDVDDDLERWFMREVVAHEAALMRYLARIWPICHELYDLRQEVYVRVFEAAARVRPFSPKSFMFTTARNLIVDRIRRDDVVSFEATADPEGLNVLIDTISPEQCTSAREELHHLARLFDGLPPRCREVMWMRKVENIPQREVASRLGIKEKAVEKQVSRGVRLLAQGLLDELETAPTENSPSDRVPAHGGIAGRSSSRLFAQT
jgi:RNA polymerase sigma factor (sigma-70 family)